VSSVRFTHLAKQDLLDIWGYIALHNSEAVADRVFDSIEESCQRLAQHPQLARVRPEIGEGARSLVIERWLALYRLTAEGVQIVRIIDGASDIAKIEWPKEL